MTRLLNLILCISLFVWMLPVPENAYAYEVLSDDTEVVSSGDSVDTETVSAGNLSETETISDGNSEDTEVADSEDSEDTGVTDSMGSGATGTVSSGDSEESESVSSGDATVSSGDATVSSGDATVSSGDATVSSGDREIMMYGVMALADDATSISGSVSLSQYAQNGGNLILTGDVTATGGQLLVMEELTIDLNGYTMTMSSGTYFMSYGKNAKLTVKDSAGGGIIYISSQFIWLYQGGIFELYGGTIDGVNSSGGQQGGCVNIGCNSMGAGDGVFNMYGGTIRNCTASQYGGAVYVGGGQSGLTCTFNMYGGTIENCNATAGAAVYVADSAGNPGYFYINGGGAYDASGEGKVVIDCDTYNGQPTSNAIYNYGYFAMEGVVDIDGIVYLNQNNWESDTTHFIKITGRLVVVGDGYIDIDSSYPSNNALCPGHTVLENATQTEAGQHEDVISREEFYTYSSYFINSTKGLMISAGYDPTKNELTNGYPSNWPSYQGDKYSTTYEYVDVMGQTMVIQAASSSATYRERQNYDYMIYTDRAQVSDDYIQYYSIKISKRDISTGGTLDGATFSVYPIDENGNLGTTPVGVSGITGDAADGMESGETYLYLNVQHEGKMMIDDGLYALVEETAPEGYVSRGQLAVIEIKHVMDESTGQLVSVVEVKANEKVLTTEEQVINSTYGDKGWLVNREVVLYLNNSTTLLNENIDYKIQVEKYQDEAYTIPLAGAEFVLNTTQDPIQTVSSGTTNENGILNLKDANGSDFMFSNGDVYSLQESRAPDGYLVMNDTIILKVDDSNQLYIDDVPIDDQGTLTMADVGANSEYGSWSAALSGGLLTIKVYDEKKPPTWFLQARKYGSQATEVLALAGAEFTLYKVETVDDVETETEVVSVVSSDGTDGNAKGTLLFVDSEGIQLELECNSKYILRETYAPQGYSLIKDIVFQVDENCSVIEVTQDGVAYTGASYDAESKILSLSIVDETVYRLPQTGGPGMYFVTLIAVLMMTFTASFMILDSSNRRRMRRIQRVQK